MKRIVLGLVLALVMAGCATQRSPNAALNAYLPFAGPPIDSFHFWDLYSWETVGPYQVVLWTTPWEAYFVTVAQPCIDLEWSHRLGVTSTANTVSHFESVIVRHHERCPITEIRSIDTKGLKAARAEAAAARKAAKAAGAAPPASPPAASAAPAVTST